VKEECLLLSPEGRDRRCRLLVVWQSVPENGAGMTEPGLIKGQITCYLLIYYLYSV